MIKKFTGLPYPNKFILILPQVLRNNVIYLSRFRMVKLTIPKMVKGDLVICGLRGIRQ